MGKSSVIRTGGRTVVVKRELRESIYTPTLIYGRELWVVTERAKLQIQEAEISFLRSIDGLSSKDRVRSSDIRRDLRVELLLLRMKRSQRGGFGHLIRTLPGCFLLEVFWAWPTGRRACGRPRVSWSGLGVAWDPPGGAGRVAGESGRLDKQDENGWMDGNLKTR